MVVLWLWLWCGCRCGKKKREGRLQAVADPVSFSSSLTQLLAGLLPCPSRRPSVIHRRLKLNLLGCPPEPMHLNLIRYNTSPFGEEPHVTSMSTDPRSTRSEKAEPTGQSVPVNSNDFSYYGRVFFWVLFGRAQPLPLYRHRTFDSESENPSRGESGRNTAGGANQRIEGQGRREGGRGARNVGLWRSRIDRIDMNGGNTGF